MATCKRCGQYASEGKELCPFDQIRNGELVKGKWVVYKQDVTFSRDIFGAETVSIGGQTEFFGLNGDYENQNFEGEDENGM